MQSRKKGSSDTDAQGLSEEDGVGQEAFDSEIKRDDMDSRSVIHDLSIQVLIWKIMVLQEI